MPEAEHKAALLVSEKVQQSRERSYREAARKNVFFMIDSRAPSKMSTRDFTTTEALWRSVRWLAEPSEDEKGMDVRLRRAGTCYTSNQRFSELVNRGEKAF
jgi:hypothetical protein